MSREFSVRSLLSNVQKHLRALRALEYPVDQWNILINHLIKEKLNNYTREKWDELTGSSRVPIFESMGFKYSDSAEAKNASLCLNCLRAGNRSVDCRQGTCRKCPEKHNTLLDFEKTPEESNPPKLIES